MWWRDLDPAVTTPLVVLASFLFVTLITVIAVIAREGREHIRRRVLAQLSLAVERNLPLPEALMALAHDLERPFGRKRALIAWLVRRERAKDAEVVADVSAILQEGDLGRALASAPRVFPSPLPEILGTAEREGTLVAALESVRGLHSEAERFRATVRSRLLYPLAVLFAVEQSALFLFAVVLPKIRSVYESYNGVPTGALEAAGIAQEVLSLAVPLLILFLWVAASALIPGSLASRLSSRGPFRSIREAARVALLTRTLAAFLRAGATIPDALRAAQEDDAARRASEGVSLARALEQAGSISAQTAAELETASRGDAGPDRSIGAGLDRSAGAGLARALELVAEKASLEHTRRLERLSRFVLPTALVALGALVASYYWPTFLELQGIRTGVLW